MKTWIKAIADKETKKDLFFADLAYAPPFTPIWEPVTVAARTLKF